MKFLRALIEDNGPRFGVWRRLSPARRFIVDFMHFAKKVPSQAIYRDVQVSSVRRLREKASTRVGWAAIYMKAFAVVSVRQPVARTAFMRWPWDHLYEHSHPVGRIAVAREIDGEECLFFMRLENADTKSLPEIQREIYAAQNSPVEDIPIFKLQAWFSKLPKLIRRAVWISTLFFSGGIRMGQTGTYALTTIAPFGAVSRHAPTLGNILISYSPLKTDDTMRITLVYDHRVCDGKQAAELLADFDRVMKLQLTKELELLAHERPLNIS